MTAQSARRRELRAKGVAAASDVKAAESELAHVRMLASQVRRDLVTKAGTLLTPIPVRPGAKHKADLAALAEATEALREGAGDPAKWPEREQALLRAIVDRKAAAAPAKRPATDFFRDEPDASAVVFLSDRSGSMVETFDGVRCGMVLAFGRLKPTQKCHIILLGRRAPYEAPGGQLAPATPATRAVIAEFLTGIRTAGMTDPIPSLARAFQVLQAEKGRGAKVIHFLTDGDFPDNKKVLATVRRLNAGKGVRIHTYLLAYKGKQAVATMKTIAQESGGTFHAVSWD